MVTRLSSSWSRWRSRARVSGSTRLGPEDSTTSCPSTTRSARARSGASWRARAAASTAVSSRPAAALPTRSSSVAARSSSSRSCPVASSSDRRRARDAEAPRSVTRSANRPDWVSRAPPSADTDAGSPVGRLIGRRPPGHPARRRREVLGGIPRRYAVRRARAAEVEQALLRHLGQGPEGVGGLLDPGVEQALGGEVADVGEVVEQSVGHRAGLGARRSERAQGRAVSGRRPAARIAHGPTLGSPATIPREFSTGRFGAERRTAIGSHGEMPGTTTCRRTSRTVRKPTHA